MATITKPYQTRKPQNKNHPAPLTTSPEESATPNGDEIWETLLAMPESEELILQMERELENDIAQGLFEKGGFGDAD